VDRRLNEWTAQQSRKQLVLVQLQHQAGTQQQQQQQQQQHAGNYYNV
jgi:hypothetical protein